MPKLKTNKAFKKRFRVTKRGKVLGSRSMRRHMLADRHPKKKRQKQRPLPILGPEAKDVKKALPYG